MFTEATMPRGPKPFLKDRSSVLTLRSEMGLSIRDISKRTGVPKSTVQDWIKQYNDTGKFSKDKAGQKGGPRKITDRVIQLIKVYMKGKERRGTRPCVYYLKNKHNIVISRHSVQRVLKDILQLYPYHIKRRPKLTKEHRDHRIATAQMHVDHGPSLWDNVAFSDECRFHLEPKPNSRNDIIWDDAPDDQKHWKERSKYGGQSVEVWGVITRYGKPTLFFIERPLETQPNGQKRKRPFRSTDYTEKILAPKIRALDKIYQNAGIRKWYFQQDGDAKHTSNHTQSWLNKNVRRYFEKDEWPANSPDLSIIENCWSIIWEEIKRSRVKSRQGLITLIKNAWRTKVTQEYIEKLYDSIPNRMSLVLKKNGYPIAY